MLVNQPVIEKFEPRELGPKSWGSELLVAHTDHYTVKVLRMQAGKGGPLQYHERKVETFHLLYGDAWVRYREGDELRSVRMFPGESWHVPAGAVHQVEAITDCLFIEGSTPVFDDRVGVAS